MNYNKSTILTSVSAALLGAMLVSGPALGAEFSACQVTDTGGIDDKSFNETAWNGVLEAEKRLGVKGRYIESAAETDYEANIGSLLGGKCNIIITVGFLLGDATEKAAKANPNQQFSIVDYSYNPPMGNVLSQTFATDEAAFLAGYLAAGTTKTKFVGVFGGLNIPPVTIFMDGFFYGVEHYNKTKGTNVTVLGWDARKKHGLFTNNFSSLDDGRSYAQNLFDEGADIILPVAGPVGLGSAALAVEKGVDKLKIIGVDADLYKTNPEQKQVYLTSILKRMNVTTVNVIEASKNGTFKGGEFRGTLANGGVDISPFYGFDASISAGMKSELAAIRKGISDGSIKIGG